MSDYDTNDLDRLLEREGARLLEARMLPTEGPLTPEQREEVRQALLAYKQKHKISDKEIAKNVGILKYSSVNQIINNTYKAADDTKDEHLRALNDWMEVDARRRELKPSRPYVETRVAKRIIKCAEKCHQRQIMALAHGPSGVGKSMVAHVIAERIPGTIYLRISSGNTSYQSVRKMLANRVRAFGRAKKRNPGILTTDELIFDKLRDSHRMIIVDEAHRISDSALEFFRDIYDECHVAVLFLCTKDLLERIRRDSDEDHGQLRSRFAYIRDLTRGYDKSPGGKNPLFTIAEIRKIFETGKVRLLPDAQGYLQDVANMLGHGSLRRCHDILGWALDIERAVKNLSLADNLVISAALLRKAETESQDDVSMLDDIGTRGLAAPAAATG